MLKQAEGREKAFDHQQFKTDQKENKKKVDNNYEKSSHV